jgi:hypothetical protein
VARLHAYDEAWGKFFARLQKDGIDRTNDENDHFSGGQGSPAGCAGVHTPCTFAAINEVHADLNTLLQQAGNTAALSSGSASDDSRYMQLDSQLSAITTERDALAAKMNAMISAAAFHGRAIDQDQAVSLVNQGRDLLDRVTDLANDQS